MSNRWNEINCNLRLCRKVHAILRQINPGLLPDHIDILAYRKNSKKCSDWHNPQPSNNKDWVAHFDQTVVEGITFEGPHICIKQDFLFFPFDIPTRKKKDQGKAVPYWKFCEGNWILIEVTVHELAHYVHLGHDEDFFKIYYKFLSQMAQVVISGEFYNWYTRQHESTKRSGKADKQTAETKKWVDFYLAWK
jgi:hypothetical protein